MLLEAITDSVIFTDLEGRIQYWNRGAEALFGYTASEMMIQPQQLDVNTVVTEAVHLLRPLLRRTIDLELELAPGLEQVMADKSRLDQVVINLVLNAREAMP